MPVATARAAARPWGCFVFGRSGKSAGGAASGMQDCVLGLAYRGGGVGGSVQMGAGGNGAAVRCF